MNALLGCPILLPSVGLNDLPPSLLVVVINTCIESVNVFAEMIVLSSSSSKRHLLDHALTSTLICRLIQIASLRYCLCALLLLRIKNAAVASAATETPRQVFEVIDTMTFDPAFIPPNSNHQKCIKKLLLYTPSSAGKG